MSTETQVPTGEETQNPAPETAEVKPEVAGPEVVEANAEAETKVDDAKNPIERMQQRIDRKHAQAAKLRGENEFLKQRLAQLEAGKSEETPEVKSPRDDIHRVADQIAEAKIFAKEAANIVEGGKKSNPDFVDRLKDLASEVGEFVQPNGLPSPFMKAVLDVSDNPTKLLYHLGSNPDLAADLAELPVTKLAARLERIQSEFKESATPKQSAAPKPLEPVKGSGSKKDPADMNEREFRDWRRSVIRSR